MKEIENNGGRAIAIKADLSKSAEVKQMFDKIFAEFGKVGILVNNAGVAVFEMIDDFTENAFHQQFNLNVLGYLLATQQAVKYMNDGEASSISVLF